MAKIVAAKPKNKEVPSKQPASEAPKAPDQDQTAKIFGTNTKEGPFTSKGPLMSNISSSSDTTYLSTSQPLVISEISTSKQSSSSDTTVLSTSKSLVPMSSSLDTAVMSTIEPLGLSSNSKDSDKKGPRRPFGRNELAYLIRDYELEDKLIVCITFLLQINVLIRVFRECFRYDDSFTISHQCTSLGALNFTPQNV